MTNEPKRPPADMAGLDGLIERLERFSNRPMEHDAPVMNRIAMGEAATQLQALAARVKVLEETLEIIRDGDYPYKQASQYAREALGTKQ